MRTGAYLSPHLTTLRRADPDRRSRRRRRRFAAAVERAAHAAEVDRTLAGRRDVTQFEALTAAAFAELAARGWRSRSIEAGLGGRYDATNVHPRATCRC